jgi:hypothetical protein
MDELSKEVKIETGERVILDKNRTITNRGTETVFIEPPPFTPVGRVPDIGYHDFVGGQVMSAPEGESEDTREGCDEKLPRGRIQTLPDNFHVAHMRPCIMPTLAEARARLDEIERERSQLRAFIRNEERLAKKHPTGKLKGME